MGKLGVILLIVIGVWVGVEVYTKGTDRAFGGLFTGFAEPAADDEQEPAVHERAAMRWLDAHREGEERAQRALDEGPVGDEESD